MSRPGVNLQGQGLGSILKVKAYGQYSRSRPGVNLQVMVSGQSSKSQSGVNLQCQHHEPISFSRKT